MKCPGCRRSGEFKPGADWEGGHPGRALDILSCAYISYQNTRSAINVAVRTVYLNGDITVSRCFWETVMIDLQKEKAISLRDAARLLPPARQNKGVHSSTLTRWISRGLRGVHLEAHRIGGRWVTSREALERFSQALTTQHRRPSPRPSSPSPQVEMAVRRYLEQVEQERARLENEKPRP